MPNSFSSKRHRCDDGRTEDNLPALEVQPAAIERYRELPYFFQSDRKRWILVGLPLMLLGYGLGEHLVGMAASNQTCPRGRHGWSLGPLFSVPLLRHPARPFCGRSRNGFVIARCPAITHQLTNRYERGRGFVEHPPTQIEQATDLCRQLTNVPNSIGG